MDIRTQEIFNFEQTQNTFAHRKSKQNKKIRGDTSTSTHRQAALVAYTI